MIVNFFIGGNQLIKTKPEEIIYQNDTNPQFSFKLTEEWEEYMKYCIIKTPSKIYRIPFDEETNNVTIPSQAIEGTFLKVSLYGTKEDNRITTNELIIPIGRGGYLEYRPLPHHDCFPHHGKYHYHHDFNGGFHLTHSHPPKPPKPSEKEECNNHHDRIWDEYHVDIYDFLFKELRKNINSFVIEDGKCYAYHDEKVVQIIPLPEWVTWGDLDNFFGDLVTSINFYENGDVTVTNSSFKIR